MQKTDLIPYLSVWGAALGLVVWQTWRSTGAGLMLAYCFQLLMLYWIAGMVHALPWAELPDDDYVLLGIQQSTYAIVFFALGSVALGPWVAKRLMRNRKLEEVFPDPGLPRAYITYGILSYFVLAPTIGRVSGFSAVASVGSQMVVVGCCLNCWKAWNSGGKPALFRALSYTLIIPAVTVVFQGFLGFGVMALSVIFIFCAQFFRPRWLLILGFLVSIYLGMSVYTTYMKGRDEIRQSVWGEQSFKDRVAKFIETGQSFEFFDLWDPEHLALVDLRLNQDTLVGHAVEYLGNTGDFAKGGTLWQAVMAMIPRILWPSKPISAGSGSGSTGLVSQFTGMTFADNTSVGIGPVMELYANFGTVSVIIGFIVLGAAIKVIDTMAGFYLAGGNWPGFAVWCLVGISFLNVSGSFVEVTMGAMASILLARFVNSILEKRSRSPLIALPDESLNTA